MEAGRVGDVVLSDYQQRLRDRFLAAPVVPAPPPWRPVFKGQPGRSWWHVFHSDYSTLRAAGFSPSGRTLAVATSSDLTLWAREGNWDEHR